MAGRACLQAAEQVAQRLGVAAECRAGVAGESDRGDGHGPVAGLLAADVIGATTVISAGRSRDLPLTPAVARLAAATVAPKLMTTNASTTGMATAVAGPR